MKAYRASVLYFADQGAASPAPPQAILESDGLLVTGPNAQGWQVVLARAVAMDVARAHRMHKR